MSSNVINRRFVGVVLIGFALAAAGATAPVNAEPPDRSSESRVHSGEALAVSLAKKPDIRKALRALDPASRSAVRLAVKNTVHRYHDPAGNPPKRVRLSTTEKALFAIWFAKAELAPRRAGTADVAAAGTEFLEAWGANKWNGTVNGKSANCWGLSAQWDIEAFQIVGGSIWQRTEVCSYGGQVRKVTVPGKHQGNTEYLPNYEINQQSGATHNADWEGRGRTQAVAKGWIGPVSTNETVCGQLRLNRTPFTYSQTPSCRLV